MGWTVAVWATAAEVEREGVAAATTAGELVAKMAACSDTTAREEATTLSMSLMADATCKLLLLLWLLSPKKEKWSGKIFRLWVIVKPKCVHKLLPEIRHQINVCEYNLLYPSLCEDSNQLENFCHQSHFKLEKPWRFSF